jgi:competence protein ComEC
LNITILDGLFFLVSGRFTGRWWGAVVAIAGIGLYTILVRSGLAVLRAAIKGGLSLLTRQVGRQQNGLYTLFFAAALIALFDPNILWDVGFQLSFMENLGLLLAAEPMVDAFTRLASRFTPPENARRRSGPVGEYILITFAAQLTTLPVVAYHFQRLSLTLLVANPAILPAQPVVMVLGGLGGRLGIDLPAIGSVGRLSGLVVCGLRHPGYGLVATKGNAQTVITLSDV